MVHVFSDFILEGPYFANESTWAQDRVNIRNPDPAEYEPILRDYHHLIARWSAAPGITRSIDIWKKSREKETFACIGSYRCSICGNCKKDWNRNTIWLYSSLFRELPFAGRDPCRNHCRRCTPPDPSH
ncbi:hypothetical protein FQR65_LT17649 [Abscondita terminalis]|nr:hypothetical protein FQR65_LT17649 [Abscondita terminalis]